MAGILGIGYAGQSEYSIWMEKTQGVKQEFDADTQRRMALGHIFEPAIAKVFELETGKKVHRDKGFVLRISKEYPGLACTIDGKCFEADGKESVVEMKFLGTHQAWEIEDEIPLKYAVQVQHQLMCTGWDMGYLLILIGNEPTLFEVPRHEALIEQLWVRAQRFLECVKTKTPPEIDDSDATWKAIQAAHSRVRRETVALQPTFESAFEMYEKASRLEKKIAKKKQLAKNQLCEAIGDAEYGYLPNGRTVKWSQMKSGGRRFAGVLDKIPFEVREALKTADKENTDGEK